jgi:outer membrane lipoprotein-sorting protein
MNRRTLLAAAALLLPVAARAQSIKLQPLPLSAQDRADVARIEANLNGLRSFKSRFLQVGPDGSTSEGTAWLARPGRMRFEYDKPSPFLLLAGFGSAVFFDAQLKQTTSVPLETTPLSMLLADTIKLSGNVTVTGLRRDPGQLQVTLTRTASPGDGTLTLVFNDNPLVLRQWAVVDQQRQETRVSLFNVEPGGKFADSLFQFDDPRLVKPNGGSDR